MSFFSFGKKKKDEIGSPTEFQKTATGVYDPETGTISKFPSDLEMNESSPTQNTKDSNKRIQLFSLLKFM